MSTNTNSTIKNMIVFISLSSSVLALPYDFTENSVSEISHINDSQTAIENWQANAFNHSSDYIIDAGDSEKIRIIIDFSKKILRNSKDMDSEFIDIVNENFWDLI